MQILPTGERMSTKGQAELYFKSLCGLGQGIMAVDRPVVILGAGATKACERDGGPRIPLTDELLRAALAIQDGVVDRSEWMRILKKFLREVFPNAQSPSLPTLLGLVDTGIERDQPLAPKWTADRLRNVRKAVEYAVFAALNETLRWTDEGPGLIQGLFELIGKALKSFPRVDNGTNELQVVTTNYDLNRPEFSGELIP